MVELCATGATGPVILPGIVVKVVPSTVQRSAVAAEEVGMAVAAAIAKQTVTSATVVAILHGTVRIKIDVTGNIYGV